jgi:hypothetical protein
VPAREVAAGVDHDHQDGADRQRGKLAVAPDGGADREYQKQRSDRLDDVLDSSPRAAISLRALVDRDTN